MSNDPAAADHKSIAVAQFNRCWDLLDRAERTADDDRELVTAALASRFHWLPIGTTENLAVADWMVSRVFAVLGDGRAAVDFGRAAVERVVAAGIGDWLLASVHEGLARAYAAAGDRPARDEAYAAAARALEAITDPEDRELIAGQLATVP